MACQQIVLGTFRNGHCESSRAATTLHHTFSFHRWGVEHLHLRDSSVVDMMHTRDKDTLGCQLSSSDQLPVPESDYTLQFCAGATTSSSIFHRIQELEVVSACNPDPSQMLSSVEWARQSHS